MAKNNTYWCPNCCQDVVPQSKCNWVVFVLLLFIGIIPGIIYWFCMKDRFECRICGADQNDLEPRKGNRDY